MSCLSYVLVRAVVLMVDDDCGDYNADGFGGGGGSGSANDHDVDDDDCSDDMPTYYIIRESLTSIEVIFII